MKSTSEQSLPPGAASADLATLSDAVSRCVKPEELWEPPRVELGEVVAAAAEVGQGDAARPGFDQYSRNVRLPHENAVVENAKRIGDEIGARARAIVKAHGEGLLTEPAEPKHSGGWRALTWQDWALIMCIAIVEMVLMQGAIERITRVPDQVSWMIGLAWALGLTLGLLQLAQVISAARPGLVEDRGRMLGAVGVAWFVLLVIAYAFALSGGGAAVPANGVTGGGVAGSEAAATSDVNWVFLGVYIAAMIYFGLILLFSHIRHIGQEKQEIAAEQLAAQDARADGDGQTRRAIQLLETCVEQAGDLTSTVRSVVGAYVGSARRELTPELASMWDTTELEAVEVPEPAWVQQIRNEITRLRGNDSAPSPLRQITP